MSLVLMAGPAQVVSVYARPLLALSALLTFLMVFKPLVFGMVRAAWLSVNPRQTYAQRTIRSKLSGALLLDRLANGFQKAQPNLANELRFLAGRD